MAAIAQPPLSDPLAFQGAAGFYFATRRFADDLLVRLLDVLTGGGFPRFGTQIA
jgi:hypothetical protein